MPMPRVELGAVTKLCTACVNASQRVGCMSIIGGASQFESAAGQFIEPDLSSMMKMSLGMELESDAWAAHASPPRLPVPELVPPVIVPPDWVPPEMLLVSVLPVIVPPVWVPPVSVPEPDSNTELLPLLPHALASASAKPADNMPITEAFPYRIVDPPYDGRSPSSFPRTVNCSSPPG